MKKIQTFCVTTFVLLGVLFATVPSCTRDEAYLSQSGQMDENESAEEAFELLNAQLDDYDAAFLSAEISLDKKKPGNGGFFRRILRALKVCLADIIGGIGGLIADGDWAYGSSYLSTKAARNVTNDNSGNKLASIQFVPTGELILPADNMLDSIGIRHNKLIKAVYQSDPVGFFSCSEEELQRRMLQQHVLLYGPVPKEVIRALPILEARVNMVTEEVERVFYKNADENSSDEELIMHLKNALAVTAVRMPEYEKELLVVMRYLETMVQLPENQTIEVYTDGFRKIVGNSGLPVGSIGKINSGISIAANSNYLWQEVNFNNQ